MRGGRSILIVFLAGLLLAPAASQAAWMEEISSGNTKDDKARLDAAAKGQGAAPTLVTQANLKYAVSLIEAVLKKGGSDVRVTWMDVDDTSVTYRVYRHTDPITSETVLSKAKLLGQVRPGVQQYADTLEDPGKYYYAVTAIKDNQEYRVFMVDQSFTGTPLIFNVAQKDVYVSGIKLFYNRVLKSVFLRWNDPDSKEPFDVLVFRGPEIMNNVDKLKGKEPLAIVEKGEESFQDTNVVPNGIYYYTLQIKRKFTPNPEKFLEAKVNVIDQPVIIPGKNETVRGNAMNLNTIDVGEKETPKTNKTPVVEQPVLAKETTVTNLVIVTNVIREIVEKAAPVPEIKPPVFHSVQNLLITTNPAEKFISLVFQSADMMAAPFYINIYRSPQPIVSVTDLAEDKRLLIETLVQRNAVKGEKFEYRDYGAKPGQNYFYAVLVDDGQPIASQELRLLDNYIKYPVKLDPPKTDKEEKKPEVSYRKPGESDADNQKIKETLKELIRDYFTKDQFALVIDRLEPYLRLSGVDEDNSKMILLFLGRSQLGLKLNKKALETFYRLRKLDEETGLFWINKSLEGKAEGRIDGDSAPRGKRKTSPNDFEN